MNMHHVFYIALSLIIGNTWSMYYTPKTRHILQQAVADNNIPSFEECLRGMLQNCIIDYQFRTDPKLCIVPLQKIFNDISMNPDMLRCFLAIISQYTALLEQASFFLSEAISKGYRELKIKSWIEQMAQKPLVNTECMALLLETMRNFMEHDARFNDQTQFAMQRAISSALNQGNLALVNFLMVFCGLTLNDIDESVREEFCTDTIENPTQETINFCLEKGILSDEELLSIARNQQGWEILRATFSLQELEFRFGIRRLFSCIVRHNDITASKQLLPVDGEISIPGDVESAIGEEQSIEIPRSLNESLVHQTLVQEIRSIGAVWLRLAADKNFFELADLLILAGANVQQAFILSCNLNGLQQYDLVPIVKPILPALHEEGLNEHFCSSINGQKYLSPRLPAQYVFSALRQCSPFCWVSDVLFYHIRLGDRQQRKEFIQYLVEHPQYNNYLSSFLTSSHSQKIMHENFSGKTFWDLFDTSWSEQMLFLAIFWHKNELFHSLVEQCGKATIVNAEAWFLRYERDIGLFEWAIICRNIALAKDIFLLGGCEKDNPQILNFLKKYWKESDVIEFMQFIDGVRESHSFL